MDIAIFGQHCSMAGSICRDPESRYGDDWRDSDDLDVYTGSDAELCAIADEFERVAKLPRSKGGVGAGTDAHFFRVAESIRDML